MNTTTEDTTELIQRLQEMAANCLTDGYESKLRGGTGATTWDDLACMATVVYGFRSEEITDEDDYIAYNAPGYVNVNPDEELEFKAMVVFHGPMGCDYIVVGWQDYEATSELNPATGQAWEDGDQMYMGHYEPEALEKGWLQERLHAMAVHNSGAMVYVSSHVTWDPETKEYDDGEKTFWTADIADADEELRCVRMAKNVLGSKDIQDVLLVVAQAYMQTRHENEPEFLCEEAYIAIVDLWSSKVMQREFDPDVEAFRIILQAQPDSIRDKVLVEHGNDEGPTGNLTLVELKEEEE